jgi:hypothetical protein
MKRIAFVVAAVVSACSSAPITTTHPLDSPDQYLVTDGITSALILDGPKGFEIVAKRDGAVISSGKDIWVYELKPENQPEADCDCFMEAFNAGAEPTECTKNVQKSNAWLTRLRDGKAVTPFESWSSDESESSASFSMGGVIGNHLVLESCNSAYACGAAHPSGSCEAVAIDLQTGEKGKIEALATNVDMEKAWSALTKESSDLESKEMKVTSVRVKFSGSAVYVEAQITTPACYACSDGDWDSYSVSTTQPIAGSEELPAPVAAYFGGLKSSPFWTQVNSENRIAIEAAFAK